MRKLHRWISTAAMLLLAWVAVTGVLLAIDSLFPPAGLGEEGAGPPAEGRANTGSSTQPLNDAELEQQVTNSLRAALSSDAAVPTSVDVQVRMQDTQPQATVSLTGATARTIILNANSGELLAAASDEPAASSNAALPWYQDSQTRLRLHDLLQDLHRGTIIGISGQVLDILTGAAFVFLSISGAVMYFQLYLRRRKTGNQQWFWK